ncbi:MAG: hypothetical protein E6J90_00700 [Deltaproteobacteria bacterium]|nr:MAG: hypothetical protein E6J90_00700 [Deltaproteobacteria bacterium]
MSAAAARAATRAAVEAGLGSRQPAVGGRQSAVGSRQSAVGGRQAAGGPAGGNEHRLTRPVSHRTTLAVRIAGGGG